MLQLLITLWLKGYFFLIVSALVYNIWKERNTRAFSNSYSPLATILTNIKLVVSYKMSRWKFHSYWPSNVMDLWNAWFASCTPSLDLWWLLFFFLTFFLDELLSFLGYVTSFGVLLTRQWWRPTDMLSRMA